MIIFKTHNKLASFGAFRTQTGNSFRRKKLYIAKMTSYLKENDNLKHIKLNIVIQMLLKIILKARIRAIFLIDTENKNLELFVRLFTCKDEAGHRNFKFCAKSTI